MISHPFKNKTNSILVTGAITNLVSGYRAAPNVPTASKTYQTLHQLLLALFVGKIQTYL